MGHLLMGGSLLCNYIKYLPNVLIFGAKKAILMPTIPSSQKS